MAKINLDKLSSFEPIRPERQTEVKSGFDTPIRPARPQKGVTENDRVDLSGKASEVGKLVVQLKELPDLRMEKVEEAKVQLQSGTFRPASGEIADAIIKEEQM